jgi:hypothetical protein
MRNVLKIFHDTEKAGRIVMDREFAVKSSIYGTQEYDKLQAARRDYPNYTVVRKTIRRNPKKEAFNGLTYEYMERYMERYNTPAETRQKYQEMRFMANCHSIRYPIIKKWFLETFPEVKDWGKMKNQLVAADVAVSA